MAVDLRIRPLGRPKISKDSAVGLQRVTRKYVVEGPKVTKVGISGALDNSPLFLAVGEPDEEFTDHYLVNQQIEPGKTVDKAYLTREYAQLRTTWHSEQVGEAVHLKTLARKYVVLRKQDDTLGYSSNAWKLHPANTGGTYDSQDPWDFLPEIIRKTNPVESYAISDIVNAAAAYPAPFGNTPPQVVSKLGTDIANNLNIGDLSWLPANASIDTSNPGIDVWSVSWKLPGTPSWSLATGKGGSFKIPQFIDFDESGFHVRGAGGSGTGGGSRVYNFTFFYTGTYPPSVFTQGSSGGGQGTPTVSMDFYFQGIDGRVFPFKSTHQNAIFTYGINAQDYMEFKTGTLNSAAGIGVMGKVQIAKKTGGKGELVFNWDASQPNMSPLPDAMPQYQGRPIVKAGGNITWSSGYSTGAAGGVIPTQIIGAQVKAVHSHKGVRIWAIQLTFL